MDDIKRKPIAQPKVNTTISDKIFPTNRPVKRQEVLFISKNETAQSEKTFRQKLRLKKIFLTLLCIALGVLLFLGAFFLWKTHLLGKKINTDNAPVQTTLAQEVRAIISPIIPGKHQPLKGEDTGRINILLMGAAGEKKPGGNLTDTIMIMSLDLTNKKVSLLSLPRDFYVPIPASTREDDRSSTRGGPSSNSFTKINSLYPIGIKNNQGADYIKTTVEKITGLTMNYYLAVDFDAFQRIIDNLGGVNVTSERDILDTRYPGPNYSYKTFALSKGFHNLDGETALMYVRERHADPEGDFGRAKRQQQVIQAVKNKLFSVQTLFNVVAINNILDTLGDNIKTDISFNDLDGFITLSKKMDLQNITNVVVDAWKPDSLLKVSHVQVGDVNAFILLPRVGNYSEIQELAQNIFNQTEIKKRQATIQQENASLQIINASGDPALAKKIQILLTDKLQLKNVSLLPNNSNLLTSKTTVTDYANRSKLFTLDELLKKLPATLDSQGLESANPKTDLVITLGSDLTSIYKYEDANIDEYNQAQDNPENNNF